MKRTLLISLNSFRGGIFARRATTRPYTEALERQN